MARINARTIQRSQLPHGHTVIVRGEVQFSRVHEQISGDALIASDANRKMRGMSAVGKPYTQITIANPVVDVADPNNPSVLETYAAESIYLSGPNSTNPGQQLFSVYNKTNFLPWVLIQRGEQAVQIELKGELAPGMKVAVVCRSFNKDPNFAGMGLQGLLLLEEPRYFSSSGGIGEGLEALRLDIKIDPSIDLAIPATQPPLPTFQQANTAPAPTQAPVQGAVQNSDAQALRQDGVDPSVFSSPAPTPIPNPNPNASPVADPAASLANAALGQLSAPMGIRYTPQG